MGGVVSIDVHACNVYPHELFVIVYSTILVFLIRRIQAPDGGRSSSGQERLWIRTSFTSYAPTFLEAVMGPRELILC